MTTHESKISEEEILIVSNRVGAEKFVKRQEEFLFWLNSFIESSKRKGDYPAHAALGQGMDSKAMSLCLNYHYWTTVEYFVKEFLKKGPAEERRINHYKIAATTEHIVMTTCPFVGVDSKPIQNLNAKFALHVSLQILFNWNIEKDRIDPAIIKNLIINDKPTKDFIKEHLAWLEHHSIGTNLNIFSNMQTLRLFHYWFRETKDEPFTSF